MTTEGGSKHGATICALSFQVALRRGILSRDFFKLRGTITCDLCGYHFDGLPSPLGHLGAFAPKCVPSPRAFAQQKMPQGPINEDISGTGLLHQLAFKHENC